MKAKLVRDMGCRPCREFPKGVKPAGTVIEHPDAHWLVRYGVADPADRECKQKAGMTPAAIRAAQAAYERVALGIHPDDYEAFERGEMVGYNPDGSWIPGPNWVEPEDDETPENDAEDAAAE